MGRRRDAAAQDKALELIGSGKGLVEAAKEAGVHRGTLHRWFKEDPKFVAAWNAWRAHARRTAASRLLGIADRAVQVVGEAIDGGDAKLAMAVVKGLGLMEDQKLGSEDARIVEREMKVARDREERMVIEAEVMEELSAFRLTRGREEGVDGAEGDDEEEDENSEADEDGSSEDRGVGEDEFDPRADVRELREAQRAAEEAKRFAEAE